VRGFLLPVGLLALTGTVSAELCVPDIVPAATFLAPYVVVDMDGNLPSTEGLTTILTVTNTGADAVLIRLTVWAADGTMVPKVSEALSG
jgi:hypothetical protein